MDFKRMSQSLSRYAVEAMLYEVTAAPKPGLVDRIGPGAHKDMDIFTFMSSAASLSHYFYQCSYQTLEHMEVVQEPEYADVFGRLRVLGIQAEKDMFDATKGVNTHKGMIFSLGIIVSATSIVWYRSQGLDLGPDTILDEVGKLTKGLCSSDFAQAHKKENPTAGEKLFLQHGITGIRGEAESGYPSIRHIGYPALKKAMADDNLSINDRMIHVLFHLMAETTDTNILSRSDMASLDYVKGVARNYLDEGGVFTDRNLERVKRIDEDFVERNISPGGSADLLAATIYLHLVEMKGV